MMEARRVVRGVSLLLSEATHVATERAHYSAGSAAERDRLMRARLSDHEVHIGGAAWLVEACVGDACFQLSRVLALPKPPLP